MIGAFALGLALAGPKIVPAKIVSASLFKNGYAVVVRQAEVGGGGEFLVEDIPLASLGTLWITGSKGVRLHEVIGTTQKKESRIPAGSIDEVLAANIGKTLVLTLSSRAAPDTLNAKILSANGTVVVLQNEKGTQVIPKGLILGIASSDDLTWNVASTSVAKAYRIKVDAPADGKVYILALERGLTWAPAYDADISDAKKLHLTAKATIVNDLGDIDNVEMRLITGFPNVPFAAIHDPFSLQQTVDEFTSALMSVGSPAGYRDAPGMMMQQNAAYGRMQERFDASFDPNKMAGFQAEDLFFYTLPKSTLKKGDRGYYVLFGADSDYQHIYEWTVADQVTPEEQYRPQNREEPAEDVWHSLKFMNTSGQPLTTAAAITTKDGEILGQDILKYTTANCETTLKITKALDVIAEAAEQESSRSRKTQEWGSSSYSFDEVILKGTLRVRNLKVEPIKIDITKELTGQIVTMDGNPEHTAMAKGIRSLNPRHRLKWIIALKAGEKKELNYTYKVLIRL